MQDDATGIRTCSSARWRRAASWAAAVATPQARCRTWSGCDVVIVETVGVGQSEVDSWRRGHDGGAGGPGDGDGIEAAKAGILEVADVFVVNKADRDGVEETGATSGT